MSARRNSSTSEGSGFWAKNGPGIMSATGTALSTTYKAGKYVGKSAYSAGKTHYKNQNGRKEEEPKEESQSFTPIESLKPADAFGPPPLKPGQMQYQKGGNKVAAGEQPLARQASYVSVSAKDPSPVNPSPSVNNMSIISPDSLQPLYNAEGQIIGYVPKQGSSNEPPQVGPRPGVGTPPPIAPRSSTNNSSRDVPPVPIRSRGPVPVPVDNVPSNATNDSGNSDGSKNFEVTPYKYISPEEREKSTKLVIDNKIDVNKIAPPPIHNGRGQKIEKKFSELVDEKIKSSSSITPEDSQDKKATKVIIANNTNNSSETEGSGVKAEEVEEVKSPAVLGKYDYEKKLDFQPPPRANVPEGVVLPSARLAQMKEESESKRHAPVKSTSTRSPPPPPSRTNTQSHNIPINKPTANRKPPTAKVQPPQEKKESAKVLGSYDYNKPILFAPPPSAKRSERDMEFITQKMERSRITSDKNMRFLQEQDRHVDGGDRRKLQILQPEETPHSQPQSPQEPQKTMPQPPPKPQKPQRIISQPPPKPQKPQKIISQPPPKPPKPQALVAPPKPKKPKSLMASKISEKTDDNPFERYNPNAAV
ncbi:uncharacterized protein HGUI_02614 [Hanseniaspora guilliermondii]|uniref:Altered inheritance of mitochondria protein 3 n=1 Tax=Hanseniaspora guilliermondii TaxID=56406 RepID=A0A1L0FLH5_9ASCO|nr:uncharacterized protein HGUI_02614 [Hanseniaspora guilliermondii]